MKVLVTGGTGLLGGAIVDLLAPHCETIYFLSRKFLTDEQKSSLPSNAQVVLGDITHPELIFDSDVKDDLFTQVDTLIHAAALYDLFGSKEQHFLSNVTGTHNVLFFASLCTQLKAFHHVSSIAVSGDYSGVFLEDDLDCHQHFSNEYARTKYESEYQVRKAKLKVKPIIYRPGILIGHSQTGMIKKHDGPYYFFKLLAKLKNWAPRKLKYYLFPFDPKAQLPVLPYDLAADFIVRSALVTDKKGSDLKHCKSYHLFSPDSPHLKDFTTDALKSFDIKSTFLPLPKFFEVPLSKMPWWEKLGLPSSMISYMYSKTTYDQRQCEAFLEEEKIQLSYQSYREVFFKRAREMFL